MQQVLITKVNGVTLTEALTIGLEAEKIVSVKNDADGFAEFVYVEAYDRRKKPVVYTTNLPKSNIDTFVVGTQVDLVVTNANDATTVTLGVTEKFIYNVQEAYAVIDSTNTACRKVDYMEGSFASKTVYVTNSLSSLATAVVTTTTTAAVTTTTTTAAVTTTTTAAVTTTTTAAVTTTTTTGA